MSVTAAARPAGALTAPMAAVIARRRVRRAQLWGLASEASALMYAATMASGSMTATVWSQRRNATASRCWRRLITWSSVSSPSVTARPMSGRSFSSRTLMKPASVAGATRRRASFARSSSSAWAMVYRSAYPIAAAKNISKLTSAILNSRSTESRMP